MNLPSSRRHTSRREWEKTGRVGWWSEHFFLPNFIMVWHLSGVSELSGDPPPKTMPVEGVRRDLREDEHKS